MSARLERELELLRQAHQAADHGHRLECVERGRRSVGPARGWTLRLDEDDDLAAFCPGCDEREFGDV